MEKGQFVERNLHEVGALSFDGITLPLLSPERFIVYGTEADPPALQTNLGPSSSTNTPHAPTLRLHFPRYIVINRNGSVNELEAASRSFNPLAIFYEMKSVYTSLRPSRSNLHQIDFRVTLLICQLN